MLRFDEEADVISVDFTQRDAALDATQNPYMTLRPDGLLVRGSSCRSSKRLVRVSSSGGLYLCRGDRVLQSFDARRLVHVVPLIRLTATTIQMSSPLQPSMVATSTASLMVSTRLRVNEDIARTAVVLVFPEEEKMLRRMASNTTAAFSNASFTSGGGASLTSADPAASLVHSKHDQSVALAQRCFLLSFSTRRIALKLYDTLKDIVEKSGGRLTVPDDPEIRLAVNNNQQEEEPTKAAASVPIVDDDGNAEVKSDGPPAADADGEDLHVAAAQSASRDGADDSTTAQRRQQQQGQQHQQEATDTSGPQVLSVHDMLTADDAEFDTMLEVNRLRQIGSVSLAMLQGDELHNESQATAQAMLAKLTASQVVIKSPFVVTEQRVENSAAERSNRAIADVAAKDKEITSSSTAEDLAAKIRVLRLRARSNPVSVLEALRARQPEFVDAAGLVEFFKLCQSLYAKERVMWSQQVSTIRMMNRTGFRYFKYFTGPAVWDMFRQWTLERRREEYQLEHYCMDLLQLYWHLKKTEEREIAAAAAVAAVAVAAADDGGDDANSTYLNAVPLHGVVDGENEDADEDGAAAAEMSEAEMASRWTDTMNGELYIGESINPLNLYGTRASGTAQRLELCRTVHAAIDQLLRQRAARLEDDAAAAASSSAGGSSHGYRGGRSRSNVFPDPVMDQLSAITKATAPSSPGKLQVPVQRSNKNTVTGVGSY